MLLPSASIETTVVCFSLLKMFGIKFILDLLWHRKYALSTFLWHNMKKSSKIGRPKLPNGAAKSMIVRARVSPSEYKAVEKAARADGKEFSHWVRQTLIDASSFHSA